LAELHVQWEVAPEPAALSACTGNDEAARRLEISAMEEMMDKEPTVFVGVDWASVEHQVCLLSPDGPAERASTSISIMRPAAKASMSRTRSLSALWSISSNKANLSSVIV
jgi:hypothetical protein